MSIKFSPRQDDAFCQAMQFIYQSPDKRFFVLSGVAGSGKTELVKRIVQISAEARPAVVAFTGRAAAVVKNKLAGVAPDTRVSTIHSLLYTPVVDRHGNIIRLDKRPKEDIINSHGFIIVDEAGMVSESLFNDLYDIGLPLVFVGDKEQLPPIDNTGFNIMEATDVHLDEIHRQAEGNPIIQLSRDIRETGSINKKYESDKIQFLRRYDFTVDYLKKNPVDVILTGTNSKRESFNRLARIAKGFHSRTVEPGEIIICLKNQTLDNGERIFNGERFKVIDVFPHDGESDRLSIAPHDSGDSNQRHWVIVKHNSWLEIPDDDERVRLKEPNEVNMTYGEAISVWKSQGSQFNTVAFYDEDVSGFVDRRKFRYTAVTRAADKLKIIQ